MSEIMKKRYPVALDHDAPFKHIKHDARRHIADLLLWQAHLHFNRAAESAGMGRYAESKEDQAVASCLVKLSTKFGGFNKRYDLAEQDDLRSSLWNLHCAIWKKGKGNE